MSYTFATAPGGNQKRKASHGNSNKSLTLTTAHVPPVAGESVRLAARGKGRVQRQRTVERNRREASSRAHRTQGGGASPRGAFDQTRETFQTVTPLKMIASNTGGLAALDQRQGVMKITTAQFYMMLAARADVYRNHKLSAGAKVFFVLITDCCHDEEEGGNAQACGGCPSRNSRKDLA